MQRNTPSRTDRAARGAVALVTWSAWRADSWLSNLAVAQPLLGGGLGALAAAGLALPAATSPELRELHNKLLVFDRFRHPPRRLWRAGGEELVREAMALDRWDAVWTLEGLAFRRGRGLGRLDRRRLPDRCSVPLHAGAGLACAVEALARLGGEDSSRAVGAAIDRFEALCRRRCDPAHVEIARETLGFAAHNLHPWAFYPLDRELARRGAALRRPFWHGAGRGLYFSPSQACGGSVAAAVERLSGAAPDRAARASALAGWGWAMALVNVRHPEVVRHHLGAPGHPAWVEAALRRGTAAGHALWESVGGRLRRRGGD